MCDKRTRFHGKKGVRSKTSLLFFYLPDRIFGRRQHSPPPPPAPVGERTGFMLKGKKERFCEEYIIDYDATKAAIRAGYSEKSAYNQGSRLLKNDEVAARVRELQEIYNKERCFANKDRVLKELWDTYEHASRAEPAMEWNADEHRYVPTGEYVFDGKTASKCLELIAKTNGMLTEKIESNIKGEGLSVNIKVVGQNGD